MAGDHDLLILSATLSMARARELLERNDALKAELQARKADIYKSCAELRAAVEQSREERAGTGAPVSHQLVSPPPSS